MDHLNRQIQNSPPLPQPPIDDKPRLPTELLILISSLVRQRNDIVTLCHVSKGFRIICTPLLYRAVTVDTSIQRATSASWWHLYKALQDPTSSLLVTHLDFRLVENEFCGSFSKPGAPYYFQQCSCIGYDDAFRKAILFLRNLESLMIHCTLCSYSHSHEYLFDLQLPLLRQFRFHCFGNPRERAMKSILLLPFMSQVTSLSLECHKDRIYPNKDDSPEAFMEMNNVIPNLKTLSIDRSQSHLLSHRRIERLCLDTFELRIFAQYMDGLHSRISQSPGTLSHFFAVDILQWLPSAIGHDPEPYRHLRYIGTVTLSRYEDAATLAMINLAPLCNLEVMEVNQLHILNLRMEGDKVDPHDMFHPVQGFFETLGDRHPLLRCVLLICRHRLKEKEKSIKGADSILWEKTDGRSWTPRPVPYLDYWEILHDKLDEV